MRQSFVLKFWSTNNFVWLWFFAFSVIEVGCDGIATSKQTVYFPGTDNIHGTCYLYRNGNMHGESIRFYPWGSLRSRANFIHGQIDGIFERFYENGALFVKCEYDNGGLQNILSYKATDGSELSTGGFHNGNGKILEYDIRGLLVGSGILKDGFYEGYYYLHARNEVIDSILYGPQGNEGLNATATW